SRSGPPSSSPSEERCPPFSPAEAWSERSDPGTCSMQPIESMHGGLRVRSANEEVGDGATSVRQTSDDDPADDPRGAPRSAQGGVAVHEETRIGSRAGGPGRQ